MRLCVLVSTLLVLAACSSSRAPAVERPTGGSATTVFGDELSLTGYSVGDKNGHTEVELRWNVLHKPAADYSVFVHALDGAGAVAFQGDHPSRTPQESKRVRGPREIRSKTGS